MTYEESLKYQTDEWVAGRPWHNTVSDECCPDFSCCRPDMMWDANARRVFASADKVTQRRMMMGGLQALLADEPVHVVDPDAHSGATKQ